MRLCLDEIFTKINPLRCSIKVEGYPIANILAIILQGVFRDYPLATKKYKYDRRLLRSKLKDVWGENIRKIAMFFVLAMAVIAVPAMAMGTNLANMGASGVDILGREGIFETESGACQFPLTQSTNFDSVWVADDTAKAYGNYWMGAHHNARQAIATNDLEIKKNQDSGDCAVCDTCDNACKKVNLEQIKVGSRSATAFGSAEALNRVKIVTNQV